ncbi:LLM class flavin-dependent oxidoreductase [Streptomyces sp. M19]
MTPATAPPRPPARRVPPCRNADRRSASAMVTVYTTCPSNHGRTAQEFRQRLADTARWTEDAGCRGSLVYNDNTLVDPWHAAQFAIDRTERFVPLVAVNPVYAHPFSTARTISTLGYLTGRRVDLNLVIGGFPAICGSWATASTTTRATGG